MRKRPLKFESLEGRTMLTSLLPLGGEGEGAPQPDFSLADVNATSTSFEQNISPRDYQGQVSGWYFGFAT